MPSSSPLIPMKVPALRRVPHTLPTLSVRDAGLIDVPAIVRLMPMPPTVTGRSQEQVQRALRLTLTHGALEHGRIWVACEGEDVAAAAVAVPSWELQPRQDVLDVLLREADAPFEVRDTLRSATELRPRGRFWAVSRPAGPPGLLVPELLTRAARWALRRAAYDRIPALVLTTTDPDRQAMGHLGFADLGPGPLPQGWWVGIHLPGAPGDDVAGPGA